MPDKAPNLQLQEPVLPDSLVPAHDFTLIWLIAGALVFLIVLAFFLRKKQVDPVAKMIAARTAAYRKAKAAFEANVVSDARDAAVRTSLILRRYLAEAAADPSLFETHEEFISRQDSLQKLSPAARDAAAAGFSHLASLKYAPEIPAEDAAAVIAGSRQLLETLNGGFQS